jgi:tetratricopeptide (TPR) repeat protein
MSFVFAAVLLAGGVTALESARDTQDRPALDRLAAEAKTAAANQSGDAGASYRAALVYSYIAEVALEQRDKGGAARAAETGIGLARRAVELNGKSAEYHRVLGTLCGQIIPANILLALQYGKCARESVDKAIELDPRSALAWVSRGVGNYYLPTQFGGGPQPAIGDLQKAIELDPKLAEAHMWLGIALRKANRNMEARAAFEKALALNPRRVWTKQQLEKTPAK